MGGLLPPEQPPILPTVGARNDVWMKRNPRVRPLAECMAAITGVQDTFPQGVEQSVEKNR